MDIEWKVANGIVIELFDDAGVFDEHTFEKAYAFQSLRKLLGPQSTSRRKLGEKISAIHFDVETEHFDLDSWYLTVSLGQKERFMVKVIFRPFIDVVHGMTNDFGRVVLHFGDEMTESQQQQLTNFVDGLLAGAEAKEAA